MTTLVLGTAGAIVGNAILPGIGGQLGFLVGSLLGNLIDPPKIEGPRRSDLKLQRSEYGQMFPFVWGTGRIAGNVIDQTDLEEHKETSGGKGGPEVTNYTYSASFLVGLAAAKRFGDAAIAGVSRIWADGRLIWDTTDNTDAPCTFYLGTEDQEPDPTFEAIHGEGNQPAYRGLAYASFTDFMLTDFGDRIPALEFEVYTEVGEFPWRVSTFRPWPDNPAATGAIGGKLEDGILTTAYYTTVAAHYFEHRFTIDGTNVGPDWDQPIYFASTGEGFRQTVVANLAGVACFNSHNHPSNYGWFKDADTSTGITGTVPVGNGSVYQNGYVYSATTGTIIRYDMPLGDPDLFDPNLAEVTYALDSAYTASGIKLGTSNDGHVWVSVNGVNKLWKLDADLNLVHFWDTGDWDAEIDGVDLFNFHVYKNMLCFDNGLPTRKKKVVQVNADWTFTFIGDILADSGPCITLGRGLVLVRDGIISLDPPAGPALLSTIVNDLSSMTSLTGEGSPESDAYDTSELTDEVRWFAVGSQMTVRNALDPLRRGFFFDGVESDDMVKFRKRGASDSVVTIDDDDLVAREYGAEGGAPLVTTRKREQGMPRMVTLRYIDVDMDYQTGSQNSPRLTTLSDSNVTLDLPIGFTGDEALQKCWTLQVSEWIEREEFEWATTRKYAWVEPCDVVTVRGRVVRVIERTESPIGVINWKGVLHRPSVYTQAQSGGSSSGFTEQTGSSEAVATEAVLLDIPVLSQLDSPFGFYAAMGPVSAGRWPGATLYKSLDGGSTYAPVASSVTPSIIGETASTDDIAGSPTWVGSPSVGGALSAYSGGDVVEEASICVTLTDGDAELSSINATALLNGGNLCAISRGTGGSPATLQWELLQFRDAELVADSTYVLSGFLRGRKGTSTSGHAEGDTFVFLPVTNVDAPQSELNVALKYKAVTFGKSVASAAVIEFTNTGEGTEEFYETEAGQIPVITNPQTGTAYTLQGTDNFKLITFDNASPVTVTLPTTLKAGWHCFVENIGAGTVTLDAGATTIDEYVSTLDLETDQGLLLVWDGDEWYTMRGVGSAGGGGGSPSGSGVVNLTMPAGFVVTGSGTDTIDVTGGPAAQFVVAAADPDLPNELVATSSGNVTFNTPGSPPGSPSGVAWWDLTTTGVTPGSYGDSYNSAALTIDEYGRVTAAANASIVQSIITEWNSVPIDTDAIALDFRGDLTVFDDGYGITAIVVPYRAPMDAPYVLAESIGSPNLTAARILAGGTNITLTDNGAGGTLDINCTVSAGGGTGQSIEYTTPGTYDFSIPEGVSVVLVTMVGGGGGGSSRNAAAQGGGGGASGESCISFPVPVDASVGSPSNTVTVIVGAAGIGAVGAASTVAGGDGGDSYFGTFRTAGGRGGTTAGVGGAGGGGGGGAGGAAANPGGGGSLGTAESACHFGGSGGAGGGSTTAANGGAGRPAVGYSTGTAGGTAGGSQAGGGSGAGSLYGQGGAGGAGGAAGSAPSAGAYGAGGGGAGGKAGTGANGGDGAGGYVLVTWVA